MNTNRVNINIAVWTIQARPLLSSVEHFNILMFIPSFRETSKVLVT